MTITLKNVPVKLHQALKKQAKANKRSLNQELISQLEQHVAQLPLDRRPMLGSIRRFRETLAARGFKPMTQRQLKAAIEEGRE